MKQLKNEYWDFDPYQKFDEWASVDNDIKPTAPRPHDAPYHDWIFNSGPEADRGRRQMALHTFRAFGPYLREFETDIDWGEPLEPILAERFQVTRNIIKWLRYLKEDYAVHISDTHKGEKFEQLCRWLNYIYKGERPSNPSQLVWFVRGNQFIEWRASALGCDPERYAQAVGGFWERLCRDVGDALHRTQGLRYGLATEIVYRWRNTIGLETLRALRDMGHDLNDERLVSLALTPSYADIKAGHLNLDQLALITRSNDARQSESFDYWTKMLAYHDRLEARQLEEDSVPFLSVRGITLWWNRGKKRRGTPAALLPENVRRPPPSEAAVNRAKLILSGGGYQPEDLPRFIPPGQTLPEGLSAPPPRKRRRY